MPFIEQQPLYDQYDHNIIAANETSPANVLVISTPLSAFVCPSAPGGVERQYNGDANGAGLPLTWTAAASDYTATTGVRGFLSNLAYVSTPVGPRNGVLQVHGPFGNNRTSRFAGVTDGTANTFIVGERTGGGIIYNKRLAAPTAVQAGAILNGGGWGDVLNGENWVSGSLYTGATNPAGPEGPCGINCTSQRGRGFHSFHPGGAQFVMADGSVQFVNATVSALALASQITRQGGEVVPSN